MSLVSDAVWMNLISTVGTVLATVVPTVAVIMSRRSTKQDIKNTRDELHNVQTEVTEIKKELKSINENAPGKTLPQLRQDRETARDISRDSANPLKDKSQ